MERLRQSPPRARTVYEVRYIDQCFAPYSEVRVYKTFKTRQAAEKHLDVPGQGRGYIVEVDQQ